MIFSEVKIMFSKHSISFEYNLIFLFKHLLCSKLNKSEFVCVVNWILTLTFFKNLVIAEMKKKKFLAMGFDPDPITLRVNDLSPHLMREVWGLRSVARIGIRKRINFSMFGVYRWHHHYPLNPSGLPPDYAIKTEFFKCYF